MSIHKIRVRAEEKEFKLRKQVATNVQTGIKTPVFFRDRNSFVFLLEHAATVAIGDCYQIKGGNCYMIAGEYIGGTVATEVFPVIQVGLADLYRQVPDRLELVQDSVPVCPYSTNLFYAPPDSMCVLLRMQALHNLRSREKSSYVFWNS